MSGTYIVVSYPGLQSESHVAFARGGDPGIYSHVSDMNVYLGRQRGECPDRPILGIENNIAIDNYSRLYYLCGYQFSESG